MNAESKPPLSSPRLFVDFHNADSQGRVRLNCRGTFDDLKAQHVELKDNMVVTLYMEDLECSGVVSFSQDENIWVAKIDWEVLKQG